MGFPYAKQDGPSIGPEAVVNDVFVHIPTHYEGFRIEVNTLIASGDRVVMEGYYCGKWLATGREFRAQAAHFWTVEDGELTRFFQAVDTAEIMK